MHGASHVFAQRSLRLGYSMAYASVQGRTMMGSVALWDTNHAKFTRIHLVMSFSRATSAELVWLGDKLR